MGNSFKKRGIAFLLALVFAFCSTFAIATPAYEVYAATPTWVQNANAWAKNIANDNSYHYVKWTSDKKTHECAVCKNHPKGSTHGWNCIGFAYAIWKHGGKLNNKCSCAVVTDPVANKMYSASNAETLKIAKERTGLSSIKIIKNKKGIPKSDWKAGDICMQYKNGKYYHTFYYMGSGDVCDSIGSDGKTSNNNQIKVRDRKGYTAHIIIRYTGK